MPGEIPREIMDAILETLPVEITILDENDRIIGWNNVRGGRIFERPARVLGQDVRACHSEKSLGAIDRMLREMRAGERDAARMWYEEKPAEGRGTRTILIDYLALRDARGRYLGCIEALQNIEDLRGLTGEKRTLD